MVADEECPRLGHVEVEDRLGGARGDGFDPGAALESAEDLAGLQVAGNRPAAAGTTEAVVDAGDERLTIVELQPHCCAGGVVVDDRDRLETEVAVVDVLAQDLVADLEGLE